MTRQRPTTRIFARVKGEEEVKVAEVTTLITPTNGEGTVVNMEEVATTMMILLFLPQLTTMPTGEEALVTEEVKLAVVEIVTQ